MQKNISVIRKAGLACGCSLAALAITPAQAQVVCLPTPLGVIECGTTDPTGTIDLPGAPLPVTALFPNPFASTATVLIDSTGPIILDGDINVTTLLDNQPALDLTSDADIFAHVTALSTQGDNRTGALLRAADDAVLVVDEAVTTVGDFSDGINITAGTVVVTVDEVRTVGVESDGVELVALSGPATLNANLIETLGSGSTAAILRAAGDIGVNIGVLRTEGDQALGLDLQSDAAACAVLGPVRATSAPSSAISRRTASDRSARWWSPRATPTSRSAYYRPAATKRPGSTFRPIPLPASCWGWAAATRPSR